jgi:8-oxo-dGTP diphosphatase
LGLAGIHLTSADLLARTKRPEGIRWCSASCHNLPELQHAEKIGVDFAVLAPVQATQTHQAAQAIGWHQFEHWVASVNMPVYALGGMSKADLTTARQAGGQGIAAISAFL